MTQPIPPPRRTPKISIALCTYNGAAYLPTQWQSLLDQQRLPDEVVVFDDSSTDDTVPLLRRFAAEAPFPVLITVNQEQVGSNKNFERALAACTGELIFVCDQDDCWFPEKIATMAQFMDQHPDTQLAFCDAWVTDENLEKREGRFWDRVRFDTGQRRRWQGGDMMDVMLDGNRVMGSATVIRQKLLGQALPVPDAVPGYIYDGWLGLVATVQHAVHPIDQPLQLYRTHPQQQVGVRPPEAGEPVYVGNRLVRRRDDKLAPLRHTQAQLMTIHRLLTERVPANAPGLRPLQRRLDHFTMRGHLPTGRWRRLGPVFDSLRRGNYRRYADLSANWYAPYLAALGDLLE